MWKDQLIYANIFLHCSSCPNPPATCGDSALTSTAPNPHILYGGVVGGPDKHDHWADKRQDYVHNEVACDYNAAFQTAIAGNCISNLYISVVP